MPARRRHNFPPDIKRKALARANGRCEGVDDAGTRCSCDLQAVYFEYDHVDPDVLSHRATLSNCQVLCKPCHRAKTALDAKVIARVRRVRDYHAGISCPNYRPMRGGRSDVVSRGLDGAVRDRATGAIRSRPTSIDVWSL